MKNLLAAAHAPARARIVAGRPLLAFDFDGTLAPLSDRPREVRPRAGTLRLLAALARHHPVVIISGRAREDVANRLDGVSLAGVAGNHGLEPFGATAGLERLVRRWRATLERDLAPLEGVWIQDKRYSLTVDYRGAPDAGAALTAITAAVDALPRARSVGGTRDLNIVPHGAVHKGTALARFMRRLGRDRALYVGDDVTDEDAFGMAGTLAVTGVRVGRRAGSRAPWYVPGQRDVDALLRDLLARSRAASGR